MSLVEDDWSGEGKGREPCFVGCFYYGDSCYRKDCKHMNHGSMLMGKTAQGDIAVTNVSTDFTNHDRVTAYEMQVLESRLINMGYDLEALDKDNPYTVDMLAAEESSTDDEWDA